MVGHSAGFRMAGGPIFRGKCNAPEGGTRRGKLQTDFGLSRAHGAEKSDVTFLLLLSALVLEEHFAAAGEAGLQQNERTMGIDREGLGFFLDGFALGIFAANSYGDLHQDALAAAAGYGTDGGIWLLAHPKLSLN